MYCYTGMGQKRCCIGGLTGSDHSGDIAAFEIGDIEFQRFLFRAIGNQAAKVFKLDNVFWGKWRGYLRGGGGGRKRVEGGALEVLFLSGDQTCPERRSIGKGFR